MSIFGTWQYWCAIPGLAVQGNEAQMLGCCLIHMLTALQAWDLFEGKHMFHPWDEQEKYSAYRHVAGMVAFLGEPPERYFDPGRVNQSAFNEYGEY